MTTLLPITPSTNLMESMRDLGYTPEVAVADVIDNSVAAGARRIEIRADMSDDASFLWILDDGHGMTLEETIRALTLGHLSSRDERHATDLGRFGLGLKTASFSQARSLTVVSCKFGMTSGVVWDLDQSLESNEWAVEQLDEKAMSEVPGADLLTASGSGTLVLWRKLDRLHEVGANPLAAMAIVCEDLRNHLGMVYHRFLQDPPASRLQLVLNGRHIMPADPFLKSNPAVQESQPETVIIDGRSVVLTSYVLPHSSRLDKDEAQREDLSTGMFDAQGFYYYRNRRLISHGGWSGLSRRTDALKFSRIRVDLPNTLDHAWHLDIKKDRLTPPATLRPILDRYRRVGQTKSARVIQYRGRKHNNDEIQYVWNCVEERGHFRYEPNFEHPFIRGALDQLDVEGQSILKRTMLELAEMIPYDDIHTKLSIDNKRAEEPSEARLIGRASQLIDALELDLGDIEHIVNVLGGIEPFVGRRDISDIITKATQEG